VDLADQAHRHRQLAAAREPMLQGPNEDEIMGKRDALIDSLERRLAQNTAAEALFTTAGS
jgi:hypothetical protein